MHSVSAGTLRRQILACQQERVETGVAEQTYGRIPSVVYGVDEDGSHGNFLPASYRRICSDPQWRMRLGKTYTANARLPRAQDRWRGELECANSSDALLMNVFCYPRVMHRRPLCALLGVELGVRAEFGIRAGLAMRNGEIDRTELDLCLGELAVEAKLTESGFGVASRDRAKRYTDLDEVFDVHELPWQNNGLAGYQLVRGVLAASKEGRRFLLLCDGRRGDLQEMWFRVLRAVKVCDVRSRMSLLTWQELSNTLPKPLQVFLASKYGIVAGL